MAREKWEHDKILVRLLHEQRKAKRVRERRCQQCGLNFPEDEMTKDHNEDGQPTGWFCPSCI